MDRSSYCDLVKRVLANETLNIQECTRILSSPEIELLPLLDAAFEVRKTYTGKVVSIHILNNAQNGFCPEDCHYCAQAKTSQVDIDEYPLKSNQEILQEAKSAYERGAFRYCMVFAGRGPSGRRIEHLSRLIREIKSTYPIEVCVSAGIMDESATQQLKAAGLDRLNHNLNTSQRHYPEICTTHTFEDRLRTLQAARQAGLQICSGMIVGLGETIDDIIEVAYRLRQIQARSIPVNFLIPIGGNQLKVISELTPEFCLRVLCLFRFLNPDSELRVAAGREGHLRSMEVMSLYPANSLFLDGYLNVKGSHRARTLRMIKDAGFEINSEFSVDQILANEEVQGTIQDDRESFVMKDLADLRPHKDHPSGQGT